MTGRTLASLAVVAVAALAPTAAHAQSITVRSGVDAETIEMGGAVTLTLQAQSGTGEAPEEPTPGAHAGFTVSDFTQAPTQMLTIVNGRRSDQHGLVATWVLHPTRPGTFTIGPPSVKIGRTRHAGRTAQITVVPRGKGPRPKPGLPQLPSPFGGGAPFDPFGPGLGGRPFDPFKALFDDDDTPFKAPEIETDPKLSLDAPRGRGAFLHATIDKTRAVVGEQVTHTVYLYTDVQAPAGSPHDVHEATATDFVKRSLEQDETHLTGVGNALVGGRVWAVQRVRRSALFPLKSGRLVIEPMTLAVGTRGGGQRRESERLEILAAEPPAAGRPDGYAVGDVGSFAMDADVTPREVEQGGAVGITIELRGTGNPPHKLATPVLPGVEFLAPQIREKLGAVSGDLYGGTRVFSYVVRLQRSGALDLGDVTFPHWDPQKGAYVTARARLGTIHVRPSERDGGAEPTSAVEVLPGLPAPRRALEGSSPRAYVTDRGAYWVGLFGAPTLALGVVFGSGLLRTVSTRRRTKRDDPAREAKARLDEAIAACKGADAAEAIGAVRRALDAAVLATTGVNLRGGSRDALSRELVDAGLSEETAEAVFALRGACEDARFAPGGADADRARALLADLRALTPRLGDRREKGDA